MPNSNPTNPPTPRRPPPTPPPLPSIRPQFPASPHPPRPPHYRGLPNQPIDSMVAAANSAAAYATRGVSPYAPFYFSRRSVGTFQTGIGSHVPVRGVPVAAAQSPKVASSSPASDSSGHKNTRNKGPDGTMAIVRGRQVKLSEDASLYSLCRSWMKNGSEEESQPQPADVVMTLPKPLPLSTPDTDKKEEEEEEEEDEENVDHLTHAELLSRHIKRAKKVRAKFREKRLQRIARYKNRLALLLPPLAEQQTNNDAATGNNDEAARNLPPGPGHA